MTVKTNKTAPKLSADEDTVQLAAAKTSREAFAAAQALATTRQSDHDNAELHAAEIEASYSQGDDRITASIYGDALTEVTRTEMLHDAAQAAEKRAESAVVNTDVTLSLLALPWVQEALKGVEVRASFYAPKTSPSEAVAFVIQRAPTEDLGGGSVASGKGKRVEVRYYRPSLYGALDAGDIQAAAERAHCNVVVASSGSQGYGDNMKVDSVQIDIQRGQSPIPLIKDEPTSRQASSHVAHAFASNLANSCRAKTDPLSRAEEGGYTGGAILVKPLDGKAVNVVDDAGVRTSTVTLNLSYHRTLDRSVNVDQHLKDVYADWQGSFVPNFGNVASIKGSTGFSDRSPQPTTPITVEIVFTSRVR